MDNASSPLQSCAGRIHQPLTNLIVPQPPLRVPASPWCTRQPHVRGGAHGARIKTPAQRGKPWGLEGGRDGAGNQVSIRLGGKLKEDFPNAKVLVAQLAAGDAYRMRSGGGGGYGDPHARPAAAVAEDVRQAYVSAKVAKELYGVVVDAATLAVDEKGTKRLRERRPVAKKRKPVARRRKSR